MKFFAIIAVLATTGWVAFSIERRFRQGPYSPAWNIAATVLGIAGLAFGFWLVTREYLASPTVVLVGFPFHVGRSELIDGRWSGGGLKFALFAFLADIAAGVGTCLLPLRIAQFIFERRVTHESTPNAA